MNFESIKAIRQKTIKELALSFVSTTGILVASSPIQVVADTAINELVGKGADLLNITALHLNELAAMTNAKSIGGKCGMALLMYGGFGLLYDKVRNASREYFGLSNPKDMKTELRLQRHDFWLTMAYSSAMLIGGYHIFGEHDWGKIACATIVSGMTQPIRGPLVGFAMDCYKDFFGFKDCNRPTYPQAIKNLSKKAKAGVAVLGVAASIGLMAGMYSLTPAEWSNPHRHQARAHYQSLDDAVQNNLPNNNYKLSNID